MSRQTQKRPNDWDTLEYERSAKRPRRAPSSTPGSYRLSAPSGTSKRTRPWCGSQDDTEEHSPKIRHIDQPSPFPDVPLKTSEEIAADVRDELLRLQRRRQLVGSDRPSAETPLGSARGGNEQPLFTFRQVGLICERAMEELDGQLREEYERVLSAKLSEQYDTFVKFTHDQIRKRFEGAAAPSYLS